jgi:hypothetical protein
MYIPTTQIHEAGSILRSEQSPRWLRNSSPFMVQIRVVPLDPSIVEAQCKQFVIWWTFKIKFNQRAQSPRRRTTPCWLSVTAYSICWQLPSISRGSIHHPQPNESRWLVRTQNSSLRNTRYCRPTSSSLDPNISLATRNTGLCNSKAAFIFNVGTTWQYMVIFILRSLCLPLLFSYVLDRVNPRASPEVVGWKTATSF